MNNTPTPIDSLRKLIADDSYAMSFQSMGQYRTALLKTIDAGPATPTTQREADERAKFERVERASNLTRDEDCPEDYANPYVQSAWEGWQARASLTPTAPQAASQQAGAPVAWIATDLDGRAGVGFTKEAAKREAGEGCTEFIPLFDLGDAPQAATTASATDQAKAAHVAWRDKKDGRAPVQAAQPALPAGFSITDAELGAIDNAISHLVGSHELPVTTGILDALSKRGWAFRAAPGAAQTTVARDAARLEKFIDWYLRGGEYAEINPNGHIVRTTREQIMAWLDRATHPTDKGQTNE